MRSSTLFCERMVGMRSRFSTIVNEVEAELRRSNRDSPYFTLLRPNYVDDLVRLEELHGGGALLEIGGYPFYFSMCLLKLRVGLTTDDLAPQRAPELIREYTSAGGREKSSDSLRVVACDIEREACPLTRPRWANVEWASLMRRSKMDLAVEQLIA